MRLPQKKIRARTKLSPLLENACSPIAKTNPPQPSPLLATSFTLTASQPSSLSLIPEITIQDQDPSHTQLAHNFTHTSNSYRTMYPPDALAHALMSQAYWYTQPAHTSGLLSPYYHSLSAAGWGNPAMTAPWNKSGQIQSVPPWFIFANNKSDGKVCESSLTLIGCIDSVDIREELTWLFHIL